MGHFLESERIYLKGIELSDLSDRYVAWMNDPDISQFMETWHFPHTKENIEKYIKSHTDNRDEPFFGIILKAFYISSERHIGNIKLGVINWVHRSADVSLFIGENDLRGKGYGTEAIKLLTEYAFKRLNLHKLRAGIYSRNVASINAFQKAGFETEAVLRNHVFFNGGYIDLVLMGKVNG
jgi:ribosomal-protein-alanine N-acetyltransferase